MPANLTALQHFVHAGWAILPVFGIRDGACRCGRPDCKEPGKHPMTRHGANDATRDPLTIMRWFNRMPGCNWAVATGARSKIWVLDLDVHNADGVTAFRDWRLANGVDLPRTFTVRSGGGGWHLYFRDAQLKSRAGILPGVDVRGDGGYVLLPGSQHISGREYAAIDGSAVVAAPAEVIALAGRTGSGSTAGGTVRESDLAPTDELREHGFAMGERDPGFQALAWRLVRNHWPHMDLVRDLAFEVWLQTEQPPNDPYPWSAVEAKIARAEAAIAPDIEAQFNWASNLRSHSNV